MPIGALPKKSIVFQQIVQVKESDRHIYIQRQSSNENSSTSFLLPYCVLTPGGPLMQPLEKIGSLKCPCISVKHYELQYNTLGFNFCCCLYASHNKISINIVLCPHLNLQFQSWLCTKRLASIISCMLAKRDAS